MEKKLTLVQKLYLEALKDGPKDMGALTRYVRDKLTEMKEGSKTAGGGFASTHGMVARAQEVLAELARENYVVKKGKLFELTEEGRQALESVSSS